MRWEELSNGERSTELNHHWWWGRNSQGHVSVGRVKYDEEYLSTKPSTSVPCESDIYCIFILPCTKGCDCVRLSEVNKQLNIRLNYNYLPVKVNRNRLYLKICQSKWLPQLLYYSIKYIQRKIFGKIQTSKIFSIDFINSATQSSENIKVINKMFRVMNILSSIRKAGTVVMQGSRSKLSKFCITTAVGQYAVSEGLNFVRQKFAGRKTEEKDQKPTITAPNTVTELEVAKRKQLEEILSDNKFLLSQRPTLLILACWSWNGEAEEEKCVECRNVDREGAATYHENPVNGHLDGEGDRSRVQTEIDPGEKTDGGETETETARPTETGPESVTEEETTNISETKRRMPAMRRRETNVGAERKSPEPEKMDTKTETGRIRGQTTVEDWSKESVEFEELFEPG